LPKNPKHANNVSLTSYSCF